MMDLSQRSRAAEIIDAPESMPAGEMELVLRELALVNRWLGGVKAILRPLRPYADAARRDGRPLRVLDLGCGGADIPLGIARWARRRGCATRAVGIDFNPAACRRAGEEAVSDTDVRIVAGDAFHLPFAPSSFDVALCSAFLHHFEEDDISRLLASLADVCREAIIISDLHRHRLAHSSIRLLTRLFSRSEAVKNDGPLSVRKGFRRAELRSIIRQAGLPQPRIRWRWAFRWVVEIPLR